MESLLTERFRTLGAALGLTSFDTRRDGQITELYLYDRHALQMEIDWRENNLFMYAVYLKNNNLPDQEVLYHYGDDTLIGNGKMILSFFCNLFDKKVFFLSKKYASIEKVLDF